MENEMSGCKECVVGEVHDNCEDCNSDVWQRRKVLHLTLKKKWFDMILSGEKTEEYREIKPYWMKRLFNKHFDVIKFRNGYSKNSPWMIVELRSIHGAMQGKAKWGAPDCNVISLKLGKIIEKGNCE